MENTGLCVPSLCVSLPPPMTCSNKGNRSSLAWPWFFSGVASLLAWLSSLLFFHLQCTFRPLTFSFLPSPCWDCSFSLKICLGGSVLSSICFCLCPSSFSFAGSAFSARAVFFRIPLLYLTLHLLDQSHTCPWLRLPLDTQLVALESLAQTFHSNLLPTGYLHMDVPWV